MIENWEKKQFDDYTKKRDELNNNESPPARLILETARYKPSDLIDMDLKSDVDYQRELVWDDTKKSRLIESLYLNIPIPPVYLYERGPNNYEVIDGKQRVDAFKWFFDDDGTLNDVEFFDELNGKKYSNISDDIKDQIERTFVPVIIILNESKAELPQEIAIIMFDRINQGSIMQNQDLRNAKIGGCLIDLANANKTPEVTKSVKQALGSYNFKYESDLQEFIIRYFAIKYVYHGLLGSGQIRDIMTEVCKVFWGISDEDKDNLKNDIIDKFNLAKEVYKDKLFIYNNRFSKQIADFILISLSELGKEYILKKKDEIYENYEKHLESMNFELMQSSLSHTKDRAKEYIKILKRL